MSLHILSIQHDRHGLVEVGRTVELVPAMTAALRALPGVESVLPLSTCNRVELLIDAPHLNTGELRVALADAVDLPPSWDDFQGHDAERHLFRVAAGLESMVVGEREIAGQVRRALSEAQDAGLVSPRLSICTEEALKTSRRVARETSLAAAGRSIVSVALDLTGVADWERVRVLLLGTGAFAGASVAAVRARGAQRVEVWSASGRGEDFARSHNLAATADLHGALAKADLVITCRGGGSPIIASADIPEGATPTILDLALHRDVAPSVDDLPGVTVIHLQTVQDAVSPTWSDDTARADRIVEEGLAAARAKLEAKTLDPAVVELRQAVMELVADEVDRLPEGRALTPDDAAHALRRLATRLLHVPSMRARQAAASGRTQEYLDAMAELYGIGAPDQLDTSRCPATGYAVADLEPHREVG